MKLLVHEDVGLMISYRGALVLDQSIKLPVSSDKSPCEACSKPCISACPADAFSIAAYDTDACKSFLCSNTGQDTCLQKGCSVRLSCPLSPKNSRHADQTKFHMKAFLKL